MVKGFRLTTKRDGACVENVETSQGEDEVKNGDEKDSDRPKEEEVVPVGFFSLFRYASCADLFLIITATIVALASGASTPAVMIIYGRVIDQLIMYDVSRSNHTLGNETLPNVTMSKEEFLETTANLCMWNAIFGVMFFTCNYIMVSFFSIAAANQAFRIRCKFMESMLIQDMSWYDTHTTGDFATRITGDLSRIQEGMGEKVGICLSFMSSTVLCAGSGIYYGWKLALVILCVTPVMTVAMAVMSKIQASVSSQELEAYGAAGAIAEEVISSIRTVVAFGGQKKEIQRYESCLIPASKKGIKRGFMTAIGSAIMQFCVYGGYALAFWYGVKLIIEERDQENPVYTGGTLIIIFFNVMFASMFIGQTAPYFEAFALARGAAAKVFKIVDQEPEIDSSSNLGHRPHNFSGHISFNDVYFKYPARPTVPVLQGLNFEARPGETIALVGSSGSGKSTIVQLILRFYDVAEGAIELDGIDVRELNLGWLRDRIGLVGQEPVLFSTTIEENIRMGRSDATREEIENAAKIANAHDFIQGLPKGYETSVGDRGTQLSGGQKQRIAIARALIRNPTILLLDEATSALDTESESIVQAALDQARQGRTTLVVAHRLSTIRTADKIVVLDQGVVKETGTHQELMEAKGIYYKLVIDQTKDDGIADVVKDEEDEDDLEHVGIDRRVSVLSSGSEEDKPNHPSVADRQISETSRQIQTIDQMDEDATEEKAEKMPRKRLFKTSIQEWPYIVIGSISALLMGVHFPAFGIIFGEIIGLLSQSTEKIEEKNTFWCLIFVLMSITAFVCTFLQIFMFSVAGEKLTFRLRKMVFANIVTQDISFFDNSKNSVGSLCSRLNSDASSVQGVTGSNISTALQALSTTVVSILIGILYNWKIGLVVFAFVPLVILAALLDVKVVRGHMHVEIESMEKASKIAVEAIESIRTVASLHQERKFYNQYCSALLNAHKQSRTKSHVRGMAYGFGQGVTAFAYAATMYYGCLLVANGKAEFSDMLKILQGVMVGAMRVGLAIAFTPDYEKARVAAGRIFKLLDSKPTIDSFSERGITQASIEGYINYSLVHFSYPSRPQQKVLRGLEAVVQPGQTVALVGSSGCGKSTCVQLLVRFYDPNKGKVLVDNEDVQNLNVAIHRSHLALVSQEPVLFAGSIADNIAYGDNRRKPDMAEIIDVARQANIHTFVTSLPQGYDTPVGDRGTQMSGGQKQRIAIARALIRNPRILLLDEATSALDAESEKLVQEALDLARSGRTCLVIAHRLTTVQNADLILVISKGRIVEQGTHHELLQKRGAYYSLHNTQSVQG